MIIFLISNRNLCCDPSSKPSCLDCSDEGSQHAFMQNKQNLSLNIIKFSLLSRALLNKFKNALIEQEFSQNYHITKTPHYLGPLYVLGI